MVVGKSKIGFNLFLVISCWFLVVFYIFNSSLLFARGVLFDQGLAGQVLSEDSGSGTSGSSNHNTPTPTPRATEYLPSPTISYYYQTYTSTSDASGSYTTDRLAQVDSATYKCISTALTSSEIERLKYLVPTTTEEEEELKRLMEKAKVCFGGYQETVRIAEAGSKISEFSDEVRLCLVRIFGEQVFNEINQGIREPTSEEKTRGEVCFASDRGSEITYQSQEDSLSEEIEDCLLLAVGNKRFNEIKSGKSQPTLEERQMGERCFGASSHPLRKRPVYNVSPEINECVKEKVDEDRFEEIKLGKLEVSEEERLELGKCFTRINPLQENILPVPPIQVPFLKEGEDKIRVNSTFQETVTLRPGLTDVYLVISGSALPGSLVDIYIFSEPIVVTTQADENGDWVYRLSDPVTQGSHVAYASVKEKSGNSVRSAVYSFDVAAAPPSTRLLEEEKVTQIPSKFITYALILITFAVLTVVASALYLHRFRVESGKSEGESGPGSVN